MSMVLAEQEAAVEPAGAPAIKPVYLSRSKRNRLAKVQQEQQQQQQGTDPGPGLPQGHAMAEPMLAASPTASGVATRSPLKPIANGQEAHAAGATLNSAHHGLHGHMGDSMPTQQHQQQLQRSDAHSNGVAAGQGAFWQS